MSWWKKEERKCLETKSDQSVWVEIEGKLEKIPVKKLAELSGAAFIPTLDFSSFLAMRSLIEKSKKLHQKGLLSREQLWLGSYFRSEILSARMADVFCKYIDPVLGWGVFALREFQKMEFIAEYSGEVRKRSRFDKKNAYCFEYLLAPGYETPYTIDARDQGGIGRYLNHSQTPNLVSNLATVDHVSHIVLITSQPIRKGEQLCFDYGPDYWKARMPPKNLSE